MGWLPNPPGTDTGLLAVPPKTETLVAGVVDAAWPKVMVEGAVCPNADPTPAVVVGACPKMIGLDAVFVSVVPKAGLAEV